MPGFLGCMSVYSVSKTAVTKAGVIGLNVVDTIGKVDD